jgi:hypothetical protein
MSHFTLAPSGVVLDAFQWPMSGYVLPFWALPLSLQTDGTALFVPCWNGTMAALPSNWIGQGPTGNTFVLPNNLFNSICGDNLMFTACIRQYSLIWRNWRPGAKTGGVLGDVIFKWQPAMSIARMC